MPLRRLSTSSHSSWLLSYFIVYLPAWIIVSMLWHALLFTNTPAGVVFLIHLLLGLNFAGFALFICVPFGKSPQLAAVTSTIACFVCVVLGMVLGTNNGTLAPLFSILFPPSTYSFALYAIVGWELQEEPLRWMQAPPDYDVTLAPVIIIAIVSCNIFFPRPTTSPPALTSVHCRPMFSSGLSLLYFWSVSFMMLARRLKQPPMTITMSFHLAQRYPSETCTRHTKVRRKLSRPSKISPWTYQSTVYLYLSGLTGTFLPCVAL